MKIFITGGAGFIGSHICEELYYKIPNSKLLILDKITYAANLKFISQGEVKLSKALELRIESLSYTLKWRIIVSNICPFKLVVKKFIVLSSSLAILHTL